MLTSFETIHNSNTHIGKSPSSSLQYVSRIGKNRMQTRKHILLRKSIVHLNESYCPRLSDFIGRPIMPTNLSNFHHFFQLIDWPIEPTISFHFLRMSTHNVRVLSQSRKLFFCTTCCRYRSLASFIDTKHHIFTAKCDYCRMQSSVRSSSSHLKNTTVNLSACIPKKSLSPEAQSFNIKIPSPISSIIPQARWVCVSSGSQQPSYGVYPAQYLFHRCFHCLY